VAPDGEEKKARIKQFTTHRCKLSSKKVTFALSNRIKFRHVFFHAVQVYVVESNSSIGDDGVPTSHQVSSKGKKVAEYQVHVIIVEPKEAVAQASTPRRPNSS
jgi:hypothetical protein